MSAMQWSYGITTVPSRLHTTFPRTLKSLANTGFDKPHLFVDGCSDSDKYLNCSSHGITLHHPALRTVGNWVAALWELYCKNPDAHRYAIFQDDLVTCLSLREYLEKCPYITNTYLNLFTALANQSSHEGWYFSNQKGLGAVALVFDNQTAIKLLKSPKLIDKPKSSKGHKAIDGAIIDALKDSGVKELVHNPSLVQHTGEVTSIVGNKQHPISSSFPGEDYDLLK